MDLLLGVDLSHHKPNFDCDRAAREGIAFLFTKATEGADFVDDLFAHYLEAAHRAGLLFAAFHYVRSNATARAQVELIKRVVPREVPVIPDCEKDSGGVGLLREVVALLREAGYVVPLTYLPRWYWLQLGRPDLSGLPPLWSSRYPDNIVGSIEDELADVPASYWDGYGGLDVAVLQFTSSAAVSNYTGGSIDANAYRSTRAQLAALLGGATQEEDMPLTKADADLIWDQLYERFRNFFVDAADQNPADGYAAQVRGALRTILTGLPVSFDDASAAKIADKLNAHGTGGITPDQVKAALAEVLGRTGLAVQSAGIEGTR